MKWRRRALGILVLALAALALGSVFATRRIAAGSAPFVKATTAELPALKVGLVLGCFPPAACS